MENQFLNKIIMVEKFVKKHWEEEGILFYIHFVDGLAIRQIEITEDSEVFLSKDNPIQGDSFLYDQSIDDLELVEDDFISENEFEKKWNK